MSYSPATRKKTIATRYCFCFLEAAGGHAAGDKATCTADGVSFKMVYVPGGMTFPTGDADSDGNELIIGL